MDSSLIKPDQPFLIWAILLALVAFGFWCEKFPWGRKYSGVMLMMALAIVLANLRILPTASPVYGTVWEYLVPLAIALLLLGANLVRIVREAGAVLIAFLVGSAAVVAGTVTAVTLLDLGSAEPQLAGVLTATYIGGSLNFAAVADATGFRDSSLLAATVAADNVVTNFHFLLIILLPGVSWLARRFPERAGAASVSPASGVVEGVHRVQDLGLAGLLAALALAFALTAAGGYLAELAGFPQYDILAITALALAVGTALPGLVARLSGYTEAGTVLMFLFLATVGASADLWQLLGMAPVLFVFCLIIVAVHLVALLLFGYLFRFDLAELMMGSAVCIGGPSSAAALASAKGWRDLMMPGILAGSAGYAIGSFIGTAIAAWLA
jgi:uncharacterized membrane protein